MSHFQLSGLPHRPFMALFDLSDDELRARSAVRCVATEDIGYPCRISLVDARAGEELLLLPYQHLEAPSPYRAAGPIFVRRGAVQSTLPPGVVPPYVTRRLISLRAYDAAHMMIDAGVFDGDSVGDRLEAMFTNTDVAYVHLHNAKRGCFSCEARRVA